MRSVRALLKSVLSSQVLWVQPPPKTWVRCQDWDTHRGCEKVYYLCNETFGGEQSRLSKLVRKWLVRARKGDQCGFSLWLGGWSWTQSRGLLGLTLLLVQGEGTHAFLSAFPVEGHMGRRKVKSCQQTSKVESDSLLQQGSSGFHSIGASRKYSIIFCFNLKLKEKFFR